MKRSDRVVGTVSWGAAVLAAAGLIGLHGCGGSAEVSKKATLPSGPAQPASGAPAFPEADKDAAKKVGKTPPTSAKKK